MLTSYIKITFRILRKHAGYASINISGLAIGIAACLLMLLFVRHEISYDRFHDSAEQLYRITLDLQVGDNLYALADAPAPIAPSVHEALPEVQNAARVKDPGSTSVSVGQNQYESDRFLYAEPSFLELFDFSVTRGDAHGALREPFTILISISEARKLFGDSDPIGKTVRINNRNDFTVGGVLEDAPENTHIPFSYLASFSTLHTLEPDQLEQWGSVAKYYHYVRLQPNTDPTTVEAKLPGVLEGHVPTEYFELLMQPVVNIHLHSNLGNELGENGDIVYVYLFSGIALFILLLACINFMNLATARASTRTREVGMRKMLGARRQQLVGQFLGESLILTGISLIFALMMVELFLPTVSALTERSLETNFISSPSLLLGLIGLVLFVGLLAGSYPALALSGFKPIKVLKGSGGTETGAGFRKILVISQFAISMALVIGVTVVYMQLGYLQNKKLGLDEEHLVILEIEDAELQQQYDALKRYLVQDPAVVSVSASSDIPTGGYAAYFSQPEGMPADAPVVLPVYTVDYDFMDTYGLTLKEGRTFSEDRPSDAEHGLIINETAAQHYGWDRPIGKTFDISGYKEPQRVIGVVKDFHFMSLHEEMRPVVLDLGNDAFSYVSVRLQPEKAFEATERIESIWNDFAPGYALNTYFFDEEIDKLYRNEQRLGKAITYFSVLAVLIACLGLFGLAAFTAERRTKEIGVRKVMGSTISGIVLLLTRDFARLVVIAFLISVPIAYFALGRWLENFAYHVELGAGVFLLVGAGGLFLATLTVGYQAVRAALKNPINSLRYE